ncbi:MAG: hypothetical protein B6241_14980 [Spirochaetaceae bacterium 4572_59]|nr:MAG: hypothetical protein B6241_14980 [Spirochaetaceae bacterium 4572_59]
MKFEISDSIEVLIQRIEEETGKPVRWVQADGMPSMVEVRPARNADADHQMYISKDFRNPEGQHLIACKGYQILRIFREPEKDRLVPSAGQDQLNNARMRLASAAEGRPDLAQALNEDEIVRSWVFGVVNQLISQPGDLHIQKAIRDNHQDLQEAQDLILEQQFKDFKAAMSEEVRLFSPKLIYDASLIMNAVYLSLLDRQIGSDYMSRIDKMPQSRKIDRLLEASMAVFEDSPEADRRMIDAWADFLHIRDWFEWVPFES